MRSESRDAGPPSGARDHGPTMSTLGALMSRLDEAFLDSIPYQDIVPEPVEIPEREETPDIRPPMSEQTFVPSLD